MIPLLAEFRPDEVRCTFIDVHPENLHSVERLLSRLGLEDYVRALWLGDAATYRHPSHLPLHIVVVETMQAALAKEPQVAITRNLVPQLHPLGALVPERIVVELAFADPRALREGLVVGRAAELTRHSIVAPHSLLMPPRPPRVVPVYLTGVQTYGPHSIPQGASGLTSPVVVAELMNVAAGERVRFDYEVGANPRLVANVVRC
ncbi:MAG TPA: hypothetical protein VJZ00_21135 [Thermoanaerobaculia bacterium]|nr:hypothetical protein [Thermoanaerobaculia bacterium]